LHKTGEVAAPLEASVFAARLEEALETAVEV
jgi:hypothetical protein